MPVQAYIQHNVLRQLFVFLKICLLLKKERERKKKIYLDSQPQVI